jgi:hypothetical protein
LVHLEIDAVELAKPDKVSADENPQLSALQFAFFAIARVTLML